MVLFMHDQFKNGKNIGIDERHVHSVGEENTHHKFKLALKITVIIIAVVGSIYTLMPPTNNNRHSNSHNCLNSTDDMNLLIVSFSCDSDAENYETQIEHTIVSCFYFFLHLDFLIC